MEPESANVAFAVFLANLSKAMQAAGTAASQAVKAAPAGSVGSAVSAGIGTGTGAASQFGSASQGLGTTLGQVGQGFGRGVQAMSRGLTVGTGGGGIRGALSNPLAGGALNLLGRTKKRTAEPMELAPFVEGGGDPITAALQQQAGTGAPMSLMQRRQMLQQRQRALLDQLLGVGP